MSCPLSQPVFMHYFDMCKSKIKHEMHLKVDNMVDRAYDQALTDLQHFFTFDQSGLPEVNTNSGPSHFALSHHNQSDTFIPRNVITDLANISFNPTLSHLNPKLITMNFKSQLQTNGAITCNSKLQAKRSTRLASSTFPVQPSQNSFPNTRFTLPNELNFKSRQLPIKHRIEIENEPMETVQAQHLLSSSMFSSIVNEQPNGNLNEEEICECDDCRNGIETGQGDKENGDESILWIDDIHENEKSFPPVIKPMLGTTQSNNGQENAIRPSPAQPTDEAQPNKVQIHDKQITTHGLQCTELGCAQTFVQNEHLVDQLSDHMWNVHSIRALRCRVKDCGQLFKNSSLLGVHVKDAHGNVREWHCNKCTKRLTTCQLLAYHHTQHHQSGHFECPFPGCTFTGEYRAQVYFHSAQHKPDLVCQHVACHYQTKKLTQFKAHERAHLGIKPYRCKWSNCKYTSASRHNTMTHIKNVHFGSKTNQQDLTNRGKPNDYLGLS